MVEIKPYSFESMRNSSESEKDDAHESQDERRSGMGSVLCNRELRRATRERMFMMKGDRSRKP